MLGQSFGGFCAVTYLSFAPHGLKEALITGGLPPLGRPTREVYRETYQRVAARNRQFFARYPQHLAQVERLQQQLSAEDVRLPSGDRLTVRRFRQLGHLLGSGDGLEKLHYLLDFPSDSPAFLHDVEAALPFARNPLYAALHEACYADGVRSDWAAEAEYPADFSPQWFTGEMVYPWMFEEYSALRPLAQAAEQLAQREWPRLYDPQMLSRNAVPVAALAYAEDMYVARAFSEETAQHIGNLRLWLTNEYQHSGLRDDGERILGRLLELVRAPTS